MAHRKTMIVGSDGREHALIRALGKNPDAKQVYALPGNGGIARDARCVPIDAANSCIPGKSVVDCVGDEKGEEPCAFCILRTCTLGNN
ncbi:MAG: phosphoribosylamine--glycine ligase N-terminal domain-containing protein [Candidatus Excrementavichristensenella sp.]